MNVTVADVDRGRLHHRVPVRSGAPDRVERELRSREPHRRQPGDRAPVVDRSGVLLRLDRHVPDRRRAGLLLAARRGRPSPRSPRCECSTPATAPASTRSRPAPAGRGSVIELHIAGEHGVPADCRGSAAERHRHRSSRGPGYVTAWPCGQLRPVASFLNFVRGIDRANLTPVRIGSQRQRLPVRQRGHRRWWPT